MLIDLAIYGLILIIGIEALKGNISNFNFTSDNKEENNKVVTMGEKITSKMMNYEINDELDKRGLSQYKETIYSVEKLIEDINKKGV